MFDKKTILITGATSGIGLETAKYLKKNGYDLVLVGRNKEKVESVCSELNIFARYICDLEEIEKIGGIFKYCLDTNIKLDGFVHAAGYAINMPIRNYKLEHAEKQMKLNYYAFLELCKCFYSRKISNDGSSIVALSSISASKKLKGSVLYSASKSALNTAVVISAREYVKRHIRVNALMPAYVDTRMNEGLEDFIDIKKEQPMGLIPPVEVAKCIGFLLSDNSKYITGSLIPISAGMEF